MRSSEQGGEVEQRPSFLSGGVGPKSIRKEEGHGIRQVCAVSLLGGSRLLMDRVGDVG